jgi:hypothetical protein
MRVPSSLTVVVCLVTLVVAGQEPVPKSTAIIHARPHTTVSGTKVLDEMVVMPGDDVETHEELPAELIAPGTTVRVLGKSRIKFENSSARILSGGAMVTTTSRFKLSADCYAAEPVSGAKTQFSVVPEKEQILVAVDAGEVLLRTKRELKIPPGRTAVITSCGKPGETTSLLRGGSNKLKYILPAAGAGGAVGIFMGMGGGCKKKASSAEPDDCHP